jgi:hypothetical protein
MLRICADVVDRVECEIEFSRKSQACRIDYKQHGQSPLLGERELNGGCSGSAPTWWTVLNAKLNSAEHLKLAALTINNTVSPLSWGRGLG